MSDHNLLKMLLDKPIAFHRSFVTIADGYLPAAIMLSQAVYWSQRTEDGWFYKTHNQWYDETGLTRREQDASRKILRHFEFWKEELRGYPAKVHFSVDFAELYNSLYKASSLYKTYQLEPPVGTKRTNLLVQNVPTDIICSTETTTETTNSACCIMSNSDIDTEKPLPIIIQAEWEKLLQVYPKPHRKKHIAAKFFSRSPERLRIIRNASHYAKSRSVIAGYVMSLDRFVREGFYEWDEPEQPLGLSPHIMDKTWHDEYIRAEQKSREFINAAKSGKIKTVPRVRMPWESEEEYRRKITEGKIGLVAISSQNN